MSKSLEIGIDEVGKGCIFGPVFSAAVVLSKKNGYILRNLGLDDSKRLSKKKDRYWFHIYLLSAKIGVLGKVQ